VKVHGPQLEQGAYVDLQTIVDLKAEQIELWLAERRGDAEALAASQAFIEKVASLRQRGDERQRERIRKRIDAVRQANGYESVLLFDARGEPLLREQSKLPEITQVLGFEL